MKIVAGALAFTLAGAAAGAGLGWLGNPGPVPVPDAGLGFVNYVGPIAGAAVGATFGFIFGGGWVAKRVAVSRERAAPDPEGEGRR